jgi:hypothetical protein
MTTTRILAIVGITTATFLAPAAAVASIESVSPAAMTPSAASVSGQIESVDASGGSLSVKGIDGTATAVKFDGSTTITVDGNEARAEDLKAGQTVVILTEEKNGDQVATSISAYSTKS